jgi:hypothetical protein
MAVPADKKVAAANVHRVQVNILEVFMIDSL